MKALFDAVQDDALYPLVKLTALYGLRRSEVLGLKWDSIDFESNILTIKHTVSRVTETIEKDKTKNSASHRSFPLTSEARAIFLAAKGSEAGARKGVLEKVFEEKAGYTGESKIRAKRKSPETVTFQGFSVGARGGT